MRRVRAFGRAQGGATAIEFALLIGPLLMLVFGVMEYGRYFWTVSVLKETSVSTARCMGVLQTSCAANGAYSSSNTQAYAKSVAAGLGVSLTAANMTLNSSTSCGGASGFSQVTLTYTFMTVAPVLLTMMQNGSSITTTACFPNQS